MIKIVNKDKKPYNFFIGRPTNWGNPFSHIPDSLADVIVSSREESIECYRRWLAKEDFLDLRKDKRDWILNNVHFLKDKILGCYCDISKERCHGEILKKLAEGESISSTEKVEVNIVSKKRVLGELF